MNAAVIKIKYANPPKDGKKQASVRTEDNQIFGVWPDKFGLLQPGRTYQVEYKERVFEGKTYRTIVKCEPVKAVEETTSPPGTSSRGLAQQSHSLSPAKAGDSSQSNAEQEFVASVLSASIQACAVAHKEEALIAEAKMLRSVYREVFKS